MHINTFSLLQMFVAHHPDTPRLNQDGIDIHPGTSTRLALSPVQVRNITTFLIIYSPFDEKDHHIYISLYSTPFCLHHTSPMGMIHVKKHSLKIFVTRWSMLHFIVMTTALNNALATRRQ